VPSDPLTERIVAFIAGAGIPVIEAELTDATFLPGVLVAEGTLQVDPARLRYPGDLLHEAGHLAVLAPATRRAFGGPEGPAGIDMRSLEVQAFAWSYAAALHLVIDPAVVFHDGGYAGRAASLLANFALGVYFGVSELAEKGMTATRTDAARLGVEPYPHMLTWLCE
jgi:hypothetical protein